MSVRRAAISTLLGLGLLCGCDPGSAPAATDEASLRLGVGSSGDVAREGPAHVGSSASLRVTLPQGADAAQLFGALLVSEPARLTQWHAEPADGVEFQGNKVVFKRAGPVKVWATWTDSRGRELTSNQLGFEVDAQ